MSLGAATVDRLLFALLLGRHRLGCLRVRLGMVRIHVRGDRSALSFKRAQILLSLGLSDLILV